MYNRNPSNRKPLALEGARARSVRPGRMAWAARILRLSALGASLMGAPSLWLCPRPAAAQANDDFERAKELYKQGKVAFNAARYEEAAELFEQSLAIVQRKSTQEGLALSYYALDRPGDAYNAYDRLLEKHGDELSSEERAQAEQRREELAERTGVLNIWATPGADVSVNDRIIPFERRHGLHVTPGVITVKAWRGDSEAKEYTVTVEAGSAAQITLSLDEPAKPAPSTPALPPAYDTAGAEEAPEVAPTPEPPAEPVPPSPSLEPVAPQEPLPAEPPPPPARPRGTQVRVIGYLPMGSPRHQFASDCPSNAGECAQPDTAVQGGLLVSVGYSGPNAGVEAFLAVQGGSTSSTVTYAEATTYDAGQHPFYGPVRRDSYDFSTSGAGVGLALRLKTQDKHVRFTAGAGVAAFVRTDRFTRNIELAGSNPPTTGTELESDPIRTTVPLLVGDLGLLFGGRARTHFALGLQTSLMLGPKAARSEASPGHGTTDPWGTPAVKLWGAPDFQIGPALGLHFD